MNRQLCVISLLSVLFLSAPSVLAAETAQNPITRSEKVIHHNLETVWAAAIQTLGQKGILIQTIDKTSGIISTDEYSYASGGSGTNKILDQYVYLPSIMFASWSRGTAKFNLHVAKLGPSETKLTMTPHFTACNLQAANYVTYCEWHETPSKGLLETKLLQDIEVAAVELAKSGGPALAVPSADNLPEGDMIVRLERLGKLRDSGVLTEDEFREQKAKILAG